MLTKHCSRCKETKDLSEFGRDKNCKDGLRFYCKLCHNTYTRAHYIANHTQVRATSIRWYKANSKRVRNHNLISKYGINLMQYNQMLKQQNECCAICKKHKSNFKQALSVDHSHKTGQVRALLCHSCNRILG